MFNFFPHKWGLRIYTKFTIGGYGEVTAKHCLYSNNYMRYGENPEKYANDHYGEFDLPLVVIYMGYDFTYFGVSYLLYGLHSYT